MQLFVTDLDGTLLNSNKQITEYSKKVINDLIEKGVQFTVATARTPATVVEILDGLNLKLPVALMNGVLIYNIKEQKYIDIKEIPKESVYKAIDIFHEFDKNVLVYGIKNDHLWVYHKDFEGAYEYEFYKERANKPLKTFVKVLDYKEAVKDSKVINFVAFDTYEDIKKISERLKAIEGFTVNYYEDVYEEDCYFLEAYSSEASKANGIKFLSRYVNHDELICFGDNINDLPMFEIADIGCAMDNAVDELKALATEIIGSCDNDGVAKYLENIFEK